MDAEMQGITPKATTDSLDKAPPEIRERYHKYIKAGNKLEVIAIPDEEPKLPDYFIVNKNAMLEFVFTGRHKLMLAPLMQDYGKDNVLTF